VCCNQVKRIYCTRSQHLGTQSAYPGTRAALQLSTSSVEKALLGWDGHAVGIALHAGTLHACRTHRLHIIISPRRRRATPADKHTHALSMPCSPSLRPQHTRTSGSLLSPLRHRHTEAGPDQPPPLRVQSLKNPPCPPPTLV